MLRVIRKILVFCWEIVGKCVSLFSNKQLVNYAENCVNGNIKSWIFNSYGNSSELSLSSGSCPILNNPDEILVRVKAASINPIDVFVLRGYGRSIFKYARRMKTEFPIIVGRDFSGIVLAKGPNVDESIKVGDEVYGVKSVIESGTFSEVITVNKAHVAVKPPHLTPTESASIIFATLTAYTALLKTEKITANSKVLILGAAGGVGCMAVQLAKSQGSAVFGVCSTNAVELVRSLGADYVFDYKQPNYETLVANEAEYDVILDCAQFGFDNVPKNWRFRTYISLNSPFIINLDTFGLFVGGLKCGLTFITTYLNNFLTGRALKWAFAMPTGEAFKFIHELIASRKIKPVIHKELKWDELPEAFNVVSNGHLRGKVVVNFN